MRIEYETELYHHGIRGQKWGVRRFQPYSYTGPRKGGKLGKEIGMAGKKAGKAIASVGRKAGGAVKTKIAQAKADARAKKVEKMTATKGSFQKNYNKLTQEERDAAIKRFTDMQKLSDMKADDLKRYANYAKSTFDIIHNVKGAADDVSTMLTGKNIGENMKKESKPKEGTKDWADYQRTMADADVKRATAGKLRAETEEKLGNGKMTKAERAQDERNAELLRRKFAEEDAEAARQNSTSEKLRREVVKASDFVDEWRKDAAPKVKDAANKAKDYGQKAADKAMDYGQKAADKAKDYGQKAVEKVKKAGERAADKAAQNAVKNAAANSDYNSYDWKNNKPKESPSSLAGAVKERQATDKKNQKVYDAVDNFTEELLRKNRKKLGHSHLRGVVVGAERVSIRYETELYHHGIRGQKWGQRRFQNADGSLTSKGKSRYSSPKFKSSESSESNRTGGGGGGGGVDDELAQLEAELAELTPGSAAYSAKKLEIEMLKKNMNTSAYHIPLYDPHDQSATGKIKYTADKLRYEEMVRKEDAAADGGTLPSRRRKPGDSHMDNGMPSTIAKKRPIARKKKVTSGGMAIRKRRRSGASQVGNGMPSNTRRH